MDKTTLKKKGGGVQKRATLDDIAAIVKVSRATVSLALNDKGTFPQSRREEIKKVAAELNYIPNPLAKALRGGHTRTIGVVTNYFSNIYFRDFYIGLEEIADAQGFSFIVSQAYESLDKEQRQVSKFMEYGVDGLIVLPCSQQKEHLLAAAGMGTPVVLISNTLGDDFAAVTPDNIQGTRVAVEHLLAYDNRPVLHIAGPQMQSSQQERLQAFLSTIAAHSPGIDTSSILYIAKGLRSQAGYACMERILREHRPPFSLFVCNDETTTGVIRYAKEHNLRLPEDIAIACFSGDTSFISMGLPVCVVAVQAQRMGEVTARLLLDLIDEPNGKSNLSIVTLPTVLFDNFPKT